MTLSGAGAGLAALFLLNRMRVMRVDVYAAVGLLIWVFVLKSGVHATLAGVLTAMAIPARDAAGGSPLQRVEHGLHPWVAFLAGVLLLQCRRQSGRRESGHAASARDPGHHPGPVVRRRSACSESRG